MPHACRYLKFKIMVKFTSVMHLKTRLDSSLLSLCNTMDKRQIKFRHLVIIYNNLLTCKVLSMPMKREYNVIYDSDDNLFSSVFYFKIWIYRKTIIIFLRVYVCTYLYACVNREISFHYIVYLFLSFTFIYISN